MRHNPAIFDNKKKSEAVVPQIDSYNVELLDLKNNIDDLMKEVYLDLYDAQAKDVSPVEESDFVYDFESNLDKFLDGKILSIIKEKDILL